MVTIAATSDLHGYLPEVPRGDVLVIAGDIIPATRQYHPRSRRPWKEACAQWLREVYVPWLEGAPVAAVVQTWGNHDWWAALGVEVAWPSHVHTLVNAGADVAGVRFYGVPQQPTFCDWAFNEADTPEGLGRRWAAVPADTDVLVTHGPPRGCADRVNGQGPRVGSVTQAAWLAKGGGPRVVICGHIHGDGGVSGGVGRSTVYNVAHVGEDYRPKVPVRVIEVSPVVAT